MLRSYLKLAVKILLRRKFFTFVSLFGISFTLLILMVATSMFDAVYGPFPPETKLDRCLGVFGARLSGEHTIRSGNPGYALLDQTVRGLPGAEEVSLHSE